MSLHSTLSALRILILDNGLIPLGTTERRRYLEEQFPDLSEQESLELSKIPNEKLLIYNRSIFAGEAGVIRNHFPLTIALLQSLWPEYQNKEFILIELLKSLHQATPWNSYKPLVLAENFCSYIQCQLNDICTREPYLTDVARLEKLTIETRREPSGLKNKKLISIPELERLSVAELMDLPLVVVDSARFVALNHRALEARKEFLKSGVVSEIPAGKQLLAGGRNQQNIPCWLELPEEIFNLLSANTDITVAQLAESYLSTQGNSDEEQDFASFFKLFKRLVSSGIIALFPL